MIESVTFDDTIPYTISQRSARFDHLDGWVITEEAPGRVRLVRDADDVRVVVQSMPYTLFLAPDPEVGKPYGIDSTIAWEKLQDAALKNAAPGIGGIISEATLGDHQLTAEEVLSKQPVLGPKRRGRP